MNVIDWLLDADPAIRWQVMRDLTDAPPEEVAAERARVTHEGWGAQLLALQGDDGRWGGGAYVPDWTSTTPTLQLLRQFGLDPATDEARLALQLVRASVLWEYEDLPYFNGEVEPCINGRLPLSNVRLDGPRALQGARSADRRARAAARGDQAGGPGVPGGAADPAADRPDRGDRAQR